MKASIVYRVNILQIHGVLQVLMALRAREVASMTVLAAATMQLLCQMWSTTAPTIAHRTVSEAFRLGGVSLDQSVSVLKTRLCNDRSVWCVRKPLRAAKCAGLTVIPIKESSVY